MQVQTLIPTAAISTCKIDTRSLCHLLFVELFLWVTTGRSGCPLPRGRPVLLVMTIRALLSLSRSLCAGSSFCQEFFPLGVFSPSWLGAPRVVRPGLWGCSALVDSYRRCDLDSPPKPFTIDQVSNGFHKERIRLAWITLLCPIIGVNIILE